MNRWNVDLFEVRVEYQAPKSMKNGTTGCRVGGCKLNYIHGLHFPGSKITNGNLPLSILLKCCAILQL